MSCQRKWHQMATVPLPEHGHLQLKTEVSRWRKPGAKNTHTYTHTRRTFGRCTVSSGTRRVVTNIPHMPPKVAPPPRRSPRRVATAVDLIDPNVAGVFSQRPGSDDKWGRRTLQGRANHHLVVVGAIGHADV